MKSFQEFLNESQLSKTLPKEKPDGKAEGYYVVDDDANIQYGPWLFNNKEFKLVKAFAKSNGSKIVILAHDIRTGKANWRLARPDGGMVI